MDALLHDLKHSARMFLHAPAVGGLGWLTCLYEPLASRMAGYIVSFAVVAGFSIALWLLVYGVNEQRWREQAKAAGQ